MSDPPDDRDSPTGDTPMARVLEAAIRDLDLPSAVEPMRRLVAEEPEDATLRRVLEAIELVSDSVQAHAAAAPGSRVQNTVPTMGIDRALFQLGMGNLDKAEVVLCDIAEDEPDNDIVERHLEAVRTIAAARSGELTRTRISVPDPDEETMDEQAAFAPLDEEGWDEGTEVQGEEEDPFDALDESPVRRPLASQEMTAPDLTGRAAVPEVTGRAAMPEHRQDLRSTMDATPHARRARELAQAPTAPASIPDTQSSGVPDTRSSALPETRVEAHPDPRSRCEDRGSVSVRPVLAVG